MLRGYVFVEICISLDKIYSLEEVRRPSVDPDEPSSMCDDDHDMAAYAQLEN